MLHHGRHVLLHPLAHVRRSTLRLVLPLRRVAAAAAGFLRISPRAAEAGEERWRPVALGPISVVLAAAGGAVARGGMAG